MVVTINAGGLLLFYFSLLLMENLTDAQGFQSSQLIFVQPPNSDSVQQLSNGQLLSQPNFASQVLPQPMNPTQQFSGPLMVQPQGLVQPSTFQFGSGSPPQVDIQPQMPVIAIPSQGSVDSSSVIQTQHQQEAQLFNVNVPASPQPQPPITVAPPFDNQEMNDQLQSSNLNGMPGNQPMLEQPMATTRHPSKQSNLSMDQIMMFGQDSNIIQETTEPTIAPENIQPPQPPLLQHSNLPQFVPPPPPPSQLQLQRQQPTIQNPPPPSQQASQLPIQAQPPTNQPLQQQIQPLQSRPMQPNLQIPFQPQQQFSWQLVPVNPPQSLSPNGQQPMLIAPPTQNSPQGQGFQQLPSGWIFVGPLQPTGK